MNWQDWSVLVVVCGAALYAGRTFVQQFRVSRNKPHENCAHCAPEAHRPVKPAPLAPKKR